MNIANYWHLGVAQLVEREGHTMLLVIEAIAKVATNVTNICLQSLRTGRLLASIS